MANDYTTLKSIISGSTETQPLTPKQVYAGSQLDRANEVLNNIPSNVAAEDRYKIFKRETRDWIPHPDNVDEMWDLEERAYPTKTFKRDTIATINKDLLSKTTDTAKMDYFKNKGPKWPTWLRKIYSDDIERERTITENRALELSRINNKLATEEILNNFISQPNLSFNRAVSQRTHTEDIYTALQYGFTKEIAVDREGRVSVPLDGSLVPVHSLSPSQFPPIDPQEEYILLADTYNMIDEVVAPYYKRSEEDFTLMERKNTKTLFEKLDKLGSKFTDQHNNIILDYAMHQPDPSKIINQGLRRIITKQINEDVYVNSYDVVWDFLQKRKSIIATFKKRNRKLNELPSKRSKP